MFPILSDTIVSAVLRVPIEGAVTVSRYTYYIYIYDKKENLRSGRSARGTDLRKRKQNPRNPGESE